MPHNPHRAQSGMFDSHGDGHPPRSAYLPAHTGCEPVSEPLGDDVAADNTTDAEEVAE
ncbi:MULTISPECIES: hypothetical protein [unclassified Kitasatospora]|uniref:hypothetical protein n=1 Tax=unclassified Kitasatospora TaxID=2633591 RepID=UPI00247567C5|nr:MULTISPECIES: hypothetical protein [unclassified Kitasatospora]